MPILAHLANRASDGPYEHFNPQGSDGSDQRSPDIGRLSNEPHGRTSAPSAPLQRLSSHSEGSSSSSSSQGTRSSQGSRQKASAPVDEEPPPLPRKPCCTCCLTGRSVTASYEELQDMLKAMRQLTLMQDTVVGGELIYKGAHLLRVGKKWYRKEWEYSQEKEEEAIDLIRDYIDEEQAVLLVFRVPRQPMPWCCVLRCPCCVFCVSFILIILLCVSGISGAVTIDTNFDSFMDSDGDASLDYNAMLMAMDDRSGEDSRRLRRRLSPAYHEPERSRSQEVLWLDVLRFWSKPDYLAHWHARQLDSLVGDAMFFDHSSVEEDPDVHDDAMSEAEWIRRNGLTPGPPPNASSNESRRLQGTALYKQYKIQLTYVTANPESKEVPDGSLLSIPQLAKVHQVEQSIKDQVENWNTLCDTAEPSTRRHCKPGVSLVNLAFAFNHKESPSRNKLYFNGTGQRAIPMEFTVKFANQYGLAPLLFPTEATQQASGFEVAGLPCSDVEDDCLSWKERGECKPFATYESYMRDFCPKTCGYCGDTAVYQQSTSAGPAAPPAVVESIRSHFAFQAFCCFSGSPSRASELSTLTTNWNDFVASFVSVMRQKDKDAQDMRIFFNGDGVEGYEAMAAVQNDMLWALASYVFVLFYATLHTRSVFLATVGLFLVLLSIPCALSIFSHASGMQKVSLMSCLSIFIVIGIGSDMLFVYTDFWKQSIQHSRDPVKRLKFTYLQASTSTAATTFTTAMSFLANLASVLRPLREFGFFMGACVVSAWLIMFFGYPPILVIGERCHRRCQSCLMGQGKAAASEHHHKGKGRRSVAILHRRSSVAVAAMLDPEKKGVGEMHQNLLGTRFASCIHDWKCCLLMVFIAHTIGAFMMALRSVEQAGGVPEIFPPDHNQVLGKEFDTKFGQFDAVVANSAAEDVVECNDLFEVCNVYKCETTGRAMGSATQCQCFPQGRPTGTCTTLSKRQIQIRIMARQGLTSSALAQANFTGLMQQQFPDGKVSLSGETPTSAECLVENWESGLQQLAEVWTVGMVEVTMPNSAPQLCMMKQVCYCGIARCEASSEGISYGVLNLGAVDLVTTPSPGVRRLEDASGAGDDEYNPAPVRPELVVDVNIVFGIKVTGTNPTLGEAVEKPYEFDSAFNIADPWAQRKLLELCETWIETPIRRRLEIYSLRCWLVGFKAHWLDMGKDWPVRPNLEDAHSEIHWYASNVMTDGFQTTELFWFNGDNKVIATYVPFFLAKPKTISSSAAMEMKTKWDQEVEDFNNAAAESVGGAWHASRLWVRAEAEKVIIDSTLTTLAISLGCVFLGIFLFTRSIHLAFLVMMVVMSIIVCLLFFMVVIMKWPIGAIEVLSLIVFVGFAVDYCLHIAHKYHTCHINSVDEQEEEKATEREDSGDAMSNSGSSPLAQAPSTSGSSQAVTFAVKSSTDKPRMGGSRGSGNRASIRVTVGDKPVKQKAAIAKAHTTLLVNNRPEERFSRARYALERMGGAVMGSACTTMGCAAFLLPCQLAVFTKIGSVVMAVTVYAIIYTLLPLPALLMQCGPCSHDLAAFQGWISKLLNSQPTARPQRGPMLAPLQPKKDENAPRRYVLHMPTKGMAQIEPGTPATRTRVTATG